MTFASTVPNVPAAEPPALLRIVEAARLTSLSRSYVYDLIAEGKLPHVRIGNAVRVPRVALLQFIERNTTGAR